MSIPDGVFLTLEAQDLIGRLLTDAKVRTAYPQVQKHPFFRGTNWETLRKQKAPFEPKLAGITDTSNFPSLDLTDIPKQMAVRDEPNKTTKGELAFVGYTYKRWETVKNMI